MVADYDKDNKQYKNQQELLAAIKKAASEIDANACFKLVRSISKRLAAVVESKGAATKC